MQQLGAPGVTRGAGFPRVQSAKRYSESQLAGGYLSKEQGELDGGDSAGAFQNNGTLACGDGGERMRVAFRGGALF